MSVVPSDRTRYEDRTERAFPFPSLPARIRGRWEDGAPTTIPTHDHQCRDVDQRGVDPDRRPVRGSQRRPDDAAVTRLLHSVRSRHRLYHRRPRRSSGRTGREPSDLRRQRPPGRHPDPRPGRPAAGHPRLLVNAPFLVYSASPVRRWSQQPPWFRVGPQPSDTPDSAETRASSAAISRPPASPSAPDGQVPWPGARWWGLASTGSTSRSSSPCFCSGLSARGLGAPAHDQSWLWRPQRRSPPPVGRPAPACWRPARPCAPPGWRTTNEAGHYLGGGPRCWCRQLPVPARPSARVATDLAHRARRPVLRHAGNAAITSLIVVSTKNSATGTAATPTALAGAAGVVLAALSLAGPTTSQGKGGSASTRPVDQAVPGLVGGQLRLCRPGGAQLPGVPDLVACLA